MKWNKRFIFWSSANSLFKWRFRSRRRCLSSLLISLCSEYCLSTATQLCLTGIAIAISCAFSVIMFCSITRCNFMHYSILQEPPPPPKKMRKWLKVKCVQRPKKLCLSSFLLPCATCIDIYRKLQVTGKEKWKGANSRTYNIRLKNRKR